MLVFVTFNLVHVNIYEAKGRYVFYSYLHYYYSCIQFFQWKPVRKNFLKVIEDDIYDELLEILKGSEKYELAKFYSNVSKKIWRLISKKNVKAKDKFIIVTGQTEFWQVEISLNSIFLKTSRAAILRYFEKWCC